MAVKNGYASSIQTSNEPTAHTALSKRTLLKPNKIYLYIYLVASQ